MFIAKISNRLLSWVENEKKRINNQFGFRLGHNQGAV